MSARILKKKPNHLFKRGPTTYFLSTETKLHKIQLKLFHKSNPKINSVTNEHVYIFDFNIADNFVFVILKQKWTQTSYHLLSIYTV